MSRRKLAAANRCRKLSLSRQPRERREPFSCRSNTLVYNPRCRMSSMARTDAQSAQPPSQTPPLDTNGGGSNAGSVTIEGQLNARERELLVNAVLKASTPPKVALEVGTWLGGGSTLHILRALEKNGQ